ncbi:MAG: glycosyltransferase family 2 protein [Candidatus Gottesmanbacteria bacterium]
MAKLSVVISAFNEERNIIDCLVSVHGLADEIILVDNTSTDKTVEIAKEFQAKIYSQPNKPMLNINKNYGFSKATGDWILNLDADERITPQLREEILTILHSPSSDINGYWIPRKNIIFGKWIQHSLWWPDEQLRLFKNGKGKFPEQHVHEYIQVDGKTGHLKNPMDHQNYSSVSQWLYKMDNIYSNNEVENFLTSKKELHWTDALKWPVSDFLKTYFSQQGYKDGLHGLVLSMLQAFYMEIVFAKIWERQGFKKEEPDKNMIAGEIISLHKDMNYWLRTMELENSKGFKRLILRILRKIRI